MKIVISLLKINSPNCSFVRQLTTLRVKKTFYKIKQVQFRLKDKISRCVWFFIGSN